jgi:hypothetical protein
LDKEKAEGGRRSIHHALYNLPYFTIVLSKTKKYMIGDKEQKEYNRSIRSIEEEQNRL